MNVYSILIYHFISFCDIIILLLFYWKKHVPFIFELIHMQAQYSVLSWTLRLNTKLAIQYYQARLGVLSNILVNSCSQKNRPRNFEINRSGNHSGNRFGNCSANRFGKCSDDDQSLGFVQHFHSRVCCPILMVLHFKMLRSELWHFGREKFHISWIPTFKVTSFKQLML